MNYVDNKIKLIETKFAEIVKYFGEDVKTMPLDKFVNLFKQLYNALVSSIKKYKEDKERKEREEKKRKKKLGK
jgi:hypothetical protein